MGQISNPEYSPLKTDESEYDLLSRKYKRGGRHIYLKALVFLEALHLAIFAAGYSANLLIQQSPAPAHGLDTYFQLANHNVVKVFHGDSSLMNRTAEADELFDRIQKTDGIVAIDTAWAHRHNLPPSVLHPENPTQSIYQIDMFHSIHCVYRIRNLLTSSLSLEEWPRNDEHTLHCLDYIREQLMCNADLTLEATDDLIRFKINNGHVCRNSDAITDWAVSHHWEGHRQYLIDTKNFQ